MTSQTDLFLNGVPVPAEWRKRQVRLGLDTAEQYEKAIQGLIGCTQANFIKQPCQKNAHSENELAECSYDNKGLSVALAMDYLLDNKKLLKPLSHFQALLVSSCCAVLRTRGIPYETLDLIMQSCTNLMEADRRRLPTHAVTINCLINKLMICGWSIHQATELFLINALSPSSLLRICSNRENIKSILGRLREMGFEKHNFSDCLRLEYSIPGLIAHLVSTSNMTSNSQFSINEICTILGYDPDKVPKPVMQIQVVHPAAVTSRFWNFHVIGPESFQNGLSQARESSQVHSTYVQPLPILVSSTPPQKNRESLPHDSSATQESLSQMARSSDRHIKHLCEKEPNAVLLLLLLLVVVGPVKLDTRLLSYAGSDRTRWATSGELETFKLGDVGLDHIISDLLIDSKEVERNLGLLNTLGLISSESWNVPRIIWLEDHLSQQIDLLMSSSVKIYWREQALILTSYFFIGNAYTKLFAEIGRLALLHFRRAISAFMESNDPKYLTTHVRNVLVEALIGSSKFSNMAWKTEALNRIRELGEEGLNTCVKAQITLRESFLRRAMGKSDESNQVILDYLLNHNEPPENPELNAIHGLLVTSMAENLYENEEFSSAHETLHKWKAFGASHHEIAVSRKGMILNGTIHLNEGNYPQAKEFLEGAFETYDPLDQGRYDVASYLIDVYCELEEPFKALNLLPEGQVARARMNLRLRRCRKFLISFAEASVCAARWEHAETILRELKHYFDEISIIERMDQQRHLRTLILHAQSLHRQSVTTSQWKQTLERWHAVDVISEKYSVIATTGMDYAVICLSISHVMHELGQLDDSRNLYLLAANRLRVGGHFWRRGMGTYWFNFVWPKLSHLEGLNMLCLIRQGAGVCLARG